MIWSLSIKSLRTLEPPNTRKFPRVNAQDSKLGRYLDTTHEVAITGLSQ